jgi:hypothetical protein
MFSLRDGKPISQCKTCTNKQKAEWKRKQRAKLYQEKIDSGKIKVPMNVNNFVCRGPCGLEKPSTEFRHNRKKCKECERLHGRLYRQDSIGKTNAKTWTENNKQQMTKLQADWFQRNKLKRNEKNVERYRNDLTYKLRHNCKVRIQHAFKNQNLRKSDKTIEYLNCSIPFLIEWFEFCFTSEMNVDNHGTYWHMDHVIPVNKFDLTDSEEITLCFSWYNLSPLKGSENISKHDTINTKQLERHLSKLKDFIKLQKKTVSEKEELVSKKYFNLCARHLKTTGNP